MGSETRARLAFVALLATMLLSYSQLFVGLPHFGPCLLGAIIAIAIVIVARRLGARPALIVVASGAGLLWYLAAVFESPHLFFGLPTPGALERMGDALAGAGRLSRVDFAPIPARPGYVITLVAAVWVAATIGELATFRWRRPLLASLAPTGLASLALVVGTGAGATLWICLFLMALLAFWGLESSHRLRSWGRWVSPWSDQGEEPQSVTGIVARRMGASCIAAAIVAPLLLPALDQGLLAWRTGASGGGVGLAATARVDILVSLAPTLVHQTDVELFRVRPDEPAYWRLTSLATFDGRDWGRSDDDHVQLIDGDISTKEPPITRYRRNRQTFTITGLGDILLPAAVQPESIAFDESVDVGSGEVTIDPDTGELRLVDGLSEGLVYRVSSHVPALGSFRSVVNAQPGDPGDVYLEVPEGVSSAVFDLAQRWTRAARTPFTKLVALQEHLRSFRYETNVRAEDSTDYLTEFLTRTRAGYCQQFATSFALLARILGYPTRVSVGFLPGAPSREDPDVYIVSGNQAHAWPEVYFDDLGWVPFEPTPRSEAAVPTYTVPSAGALANLARIRNGVEAPPPQLFEGRRGELADVSKVRGGGAGGPLGGAGGGPLRDQAWIRAFNRFARIALLVLGGLIVLVPLLKEWRVRSRYRRARTPSERAVAAFRHLEAEGAELASARRPAESATAYAARLARSNRVVGGNSRDLATIYEAAEYGRGAVSAAEGERAVLLAKQLRGSLWESASWWQRATRLLSPRSLVPRGGGARRIASPAPA